MVERCGNCIHRGARSDGGCTYSQELPVRPNPDSKCMFLKNGGQSKFQPNLNREAHGRLIVPHEPVGSYPQSEYIKLDPPKPTGYADVCGEKDGEVFKFRVKNGKCYSADDELRYLGTLEELQPAPAGGEEMNEVIASMRDSLNKQFNLIEEKENG